MSITARPLYGSHIAELVTHEPRVAVDTPLQIRESTSEARPLLQSTCKFVSFLRRTSFLRREEQLYPEGVETVVHRVISITSPQTLPNIHIPVTLAHRTTEAGSSARTHGVLTRCQRGSARRSRRRPSHRRCTRRTDVVLGQIDPGLR